MNTPLRTLPTLDAAVRDRELSIAGAELVGNQLRPRLLELLDDLAWQERHSPAVGGMSVARLREALGLAVV